MIIIALINGLYVPCDLFYHGHDEDKPCFHTLVGGFRSYDEADHWVKSITNPDKVVLLYQSLLSAPSVSMNRIHNGD